jgi:putative endonuclease
MAPRPNEHRRRGAHLFGLHAEWIAGAFLMLKGYRVLTRRYAVAGGEIDLIARRFEVVAFVEVKGRDDLDRAAGAIT